MKITKLELDRFSAFKQATFEFSPGINVLLGANGTGKSHLMKLLHCVLKTHRDVGEGNGGQHNTFGTRLAQKLDAVYRPDNHGIGRLVYRKVGKSKATVRLCADEGEVCFRLTTQGNVHVDARTLPEAERVLFIPSREALAMYEGFIAAYEGRELAFDETYYDLCVALSANPLKGPRAGAASQLAKPLEQVLGGTVHLQGNKFFVYSDDGFIEAHLLAEGLRKIASLVRVIVNGSLMRNGFLFWDEPEANLNPKLVTVVAGTLRRLAAAGVQIFVSTHDYLLSTKLSLAAEYRQQQPKDLQCDMRFFCLAREGAGAVNVESAPVLPLLKNNPILQEFAEHYNEETRLFSQD